MGNKKERQINRIKSLLIYLVHNGPTSSKKLAEEFECSIKTIQADLKILRDCNDLVTDIKPGIWKATKSIRNVG